MIRCRPQLASLSDVARDGELLTLVRTLSSAIDAKDAYTSGHSERVAGMAVHLGQALGCDRSQCETLLLAGLLHDIGKISLNGDVLRKPGPLTADEYAHVQSHVELGYRMLSGIGPLADVLPAVRHHHERWDGNGYPDRLSQRRIPLIARILAVADALDAMTSDRPYRRGLPIERADQTFRDGAGQQWDPQVIDAYFSLQPSRSRVPAP